MDYQKLWHYFTSFLAHIANRDFSHLLLTFVYSLDPDQDRQNVDPNLDEKTFGTLIVFLKEDFFKKFNFVKVSSMVEI